MIPAKRALALVAWTAALIILGPPAAGGDWPGWRGANRDGISPEVPERLPGMTTPAAAPATGGSEAAFPTPEPLWRRPLTGQAMAGIAVADGYVVVADFGEKKNDLYRCFTADKGEPVWTHSCDNAAKVEYGPSPRATPLVRDGKVYVCGSAGDLFCLDLKKGLVLWAMSFTKTFGTKPPTWGYSSSLLEADGKLIINPGAEQASLVALDPQTGKVLWKTPGKGPAYGSLICGEFGGRRQIVGWDAASLGGWDPATGKRLWEIVCEGEPYYIVPTPVAWKGKLLVCDAESTRLYDFDPQGRIVAKPTAMSEELTTEMGTPTVLDGIALTTGGGLIALDLGAGLKRLWTNDQLDGFMSFTHIVAGNGRALVFAEDGTASLVVPGKTECRVLGTVRLSDRTWSHPALANGRLYVRDDKWLYCYPLGPANAGTGK